MLFRRATRSDYTDPNNFTYGKIYFQSRSVVKTAGKTEWTEYTVNLHIRGAAVNIYSHDSNNQLNVTVNNVTVINNTITGVTMGGTCSAESKTTDGSNVILNLDGGIFTIQVPVQAGIWDVTNGTFVSKTSYA